MDNKAAVKTVKGKSHKAMNTQHRKHIKTASAKKHMKVARHGNNHVKHLAPAPAPEFPTPSTLQYNKYATNLYVAAFETGALDVLDRSLQSGVVNQKPGVRGCLAPSKFGGCAAGRATGLTGSVVVSPDGRNVYSTSQASSAVDIFRRIR